MCAHYNPKRGGTMTLRMYAALLALLSGCSFSTLGAQEHWDVLSKPSYYEYPAVAVDSPFDFLLAGGFLKGAVTGAAARSAARRAIVALEQAAVKKAAEKGGAAAPAVVEGAAAVEYEVMSAIEVELIMARRLEQQTAAAIEAGRRFAAGRSAEAVVRSKGQLQNMMNADLRTSYNRYSTLAAQAEEYLTLAGENRAIPDEAREGARLIIEESTECMQEIVEVLAQRGVKPN